MKKIAVFASGSGSNFEALVQRFEDSLSIQISLLVCDRPQAYVVERAKHRDIPTLVLSPREFPSKEAYEAVILERCQQEQIEFIVLAGYMRLIGPTLLRPFMGRMINIHPSLLPAFPGKDAIGQALDYGVRVTGVTVHFVDDGMDTGPIIVQRATEVDPEEHKESVSSKIQAIEHDLYPQIVEKCVLNQIEMREGKVRWLKSKEH